MMVKISEFPATHCWAQAIQVTSDFVSRRLYWRTVGVSAYVHFHVGRGIRHQYIRKIVTLAQHKECVLA